jgi:hypothetical protein
MRIERLPDESLFNILERLAGEGYLQNNRRLEAEFDGEPSSRFVELICSMENLGTLDLLGYKLTPEVLAHVLQSCSKITDLRIVAIEDGMLKMDELQKIN